MGSRHRIFLIAAIVVLFGLLVLIIFGDNGLSDFNAMRQERDQMIRNNNELARENLSMSREIDRLENDLEYIESVARKESGMVGADEIVIQFKDKDKKEPMSR